MSRTLLILAGGTGGHIMPGLAVASAMRERGWQVHWLGTSHGMENDLVPRAGLPLSTVAFAGMRGKGRLHALRGLGQLLHALGDCFRLVGRLRPAAVLGMGGYVTVPGGVSAALRGAPLVVLNSDAALLLSNRLLAPFARRVLYGLPPEHTLAGKTIWTGCPIRSEITAVAPPEERYAGRTGPLQLLVLGGSLGASVLNRIVPDALALLPQGARPRVVHQTGAAHAAEVAKRYADAGIEAEVVPFVEDMAAAYARADVVLCRAGAITVSELTAAGVASILVPLTVSTTSHQRHNAELLSKAGAAIHIPQNQLASATLAELFLGLKRERLCDMAIAARRLGKPDATAAVAGVLETVARPEPDSSR